MGSTPNLTMLGDAAPLMPPFTVKGVNNWPCWDAVELSQCLVSGEFPDIHAAIAAYESRCVPAPPKKHKLHESTDSITTRNAIGFLLGVIS